jgi:hypothetical protein
VLVADTVYRVEHEVAEPWQEMRSAAQLMGSVASRWPSDTQLADSAWSNAEAPGPGRAREVFREVGLYALPQGPFDVVLKARTATLEQFCEGLLAGHGATDDTSLLRCAWRRLSPPTLHRGDGYLASAWTIDLDYPTPVRVGLSESLLGPHRRSHVPDHVGASFHGPMTSCEGYMCSAPLAELLAPGPSSPVAGVIEALRARVLQGTPLPPEMIADGPASSEQDFDFLKAVLRGLAGGSAEVAWLPRGARRVSVLFSYLVDAGEARVAMSLELAPAGWILDRFDYEPVAASLTGNSGARMDLMPMLRALRPASGS